MTGVDTNVLLRLYVADDAKQHKAAAAFFARRSQADPAYVRLIVFVEFVWSLRRTYKYPWSRVMALVTALLATSDIEIERGDIVAAAVMQASEDGAGMVDAIIAMANAADGCSATLTFDRKAARRIASMELLS